MDSSPQTPNTNSTPTSAPESTSGTSTPFGNPTAFTSESSGKGKTIALVCTSVLAVLGLAFGIFEFLQVKTSANNCKTNNSSDASTSQEITSFSLEVTNPDGTVAGLQTDQFTIENGTLSATYSDPTVTLLINVDDGSTPMTEPAHRYVFVPEWGIRIHIPEGLALYGSGLYTDGSENVYLAIAGKDCRDSSRCDGNPAFASVSNAHNLGALTRSSEPYDKNQPREGRDYVTTIDGYSYYYSHPQAAFSQDPSDAQWEADTISLIQEMLTNPGNFAAY